VLRTVSCHFALDISKLTASYGKIIQNTKNATIRALLLLPKEQSYVARWNKNGTR